MPVIELDHVSHAFADGVGSPLVVDDLTNVTLADLAALTNPANNH